MRKNYLRLTISISAMLLVLTTGCQTVRPGAATGGAFGTLAGGLTGAAIGAHDGKATEGALIGALTGGTLGTVAGNAVDREVERDRLNYQTANAAQRQAAVSMHQLIQMTDNGLGKNIIISQISNQGIDRRPNINDLIVLKNRGVDEDVIQTFQTARVAGSYNQPTQPAVIGPPVYVDRFAAPPIYGYGYRRGCRPRREFTINF